MRLASAEPVFPKMKSQHRGQSTLQQRFQSLPGEHRVQTASLSRGRLSGGTQELSTETEKQSKTQKPEEMGTQYLCQGQSIRFGEQFQYGAFPLQRCQGFS